MKEVPASTQKGKLRGGDAYDPGPAHRPPGAGPGSPSVPPPGAWTAGEDTNDVVAGPLPALQALAGRFGTGLSATERLAFLRATVNRGGSLDPADLTWLLDYAEGWLERDRLILTALEIFHDGLKDAIGGDRQEAAP